LEAVTGAWNQNSLSTAGCLCEISGAVRVVGIVGGEAVKGGEVMGFGIEGGYPMGRSFI